MKAFLLYRGRDNLKRGGALKRYTRTADDDEEEEEKGEEKISIQILKQEWDINNETLCRVRIYYLTPFRIRFSHDTLLFY